jgi:hypothetical protein
MRKVAIALAATTAMMLAGWADATALTEPARPPTATRDNPPIENVNCPGIRRRDRCPFGLYLACTLDRRCACISCYAFRRYPNDDYWYRWRY